VKLEL